MEAMTTDNQADVPLLETLRVTAAALGPKGVMLNKAADEIERLHGILSAIDRYSVSTLRTNSKDRGDWADDMAFVGKLAREH